VAKEAKVLNYYLTWQNGVKSAKHEFLWEDGAVKPDPVPQNHVDWNSVHGDLQSWFNTKLAKYQSAHGADTQKFEINLGWREENDKYIASIHYRWKQGNGYGKARDTLDYSADVPATCDTQFKNLLQSCKDQEGITA